MLRIFSYISSMCMYKGANNTEKMVSNTEYILNNKNKRILRKKPFFWLQNVSFTS